MFVIVITLHLLLLPLLQFCPSFCGPSTLTIHDTWCCIFCQSFSNSFVRFLCSVLILQPCWFRANVVGCVDTDFTCSMFCFIGSFTLSLVWMVTARVLGLIIRSSVCCFVVLLLMLLFCQYFWFSTVYSWFHVVCFIASFSVSIYSFAMTFLFLENQNLKCSITQKITKTCRSTFFCNAFSASPQNVYMKSGKLFAEKKANLEFKLQYKQSSTFYF